MNLVIVILLLCCSLSFEAASSFPIGSRSLLRAISDESDADLPDVAVELNATNFESVLKGSPASFAIVEFFAHWCPACRNYKPHYERVARLFNGPNAVHPGIILMTRVDCAHKINTKLCDRFSVNHYPFLLWAPPAKFAFESSVPEKDGDIKTIDDGRTAERLLKWINKQMGSSYGLDDEKYEHEDLQTNTSEASQIMRAIYDIEEATSSAFEIILEHKMIKTGTRASLIRFLQLLVAHHPSRRCRSGSAEILVNFDDLCAADLINKKKALACNRTTELANFHICGKEVPRGYWMFCRGSRGDTRGFSCGLWVLFHAISARIEDAESHLAFMTICDFIHNFFICEECREHFHSMCLSVSSPFNTTRDFALWLWNAHNKVNVRLMKEESDMGTGDPKFPKIVWPPKSLCPSCYASSSQKSNASSEIEWNRDEVFKFLVVYYGETLVSVHKEKEIASDAAIEHAVSEDAAGTTSAVVVPIGAAVAIAVASCAFGAVACFWRSRQKSRKYRHHLHSLKNI